MALSQDQLQALLDRIGVTTSKAKRRLSYHL